MGSSGDTAARWRVREALIVIAGISAVIAVLVGILALTVLPPALANLSAQAVEADTRVPIADGDEASVLVPAGWVLQRSAVGEGALRVGSPDAELTVSLVATDAGVDAAFAGATDAPGAVTERLASGLDARHVFAADGFVAAVGSGRTAVVVRAEAAPGAELGRYDTALAMILDGIRIDASAPVAEGDA
ncbi:hypothetical protein [Microbacterium xanthum]|uniref:hypothetical protein n=1 Tax=Microbacterium xanthum TaxID=3079794 RepID=UPI002AD21D78|nr:hypothetical protein [Microbacterium sp. KSW-48]MDZ8170914.1 hypothetical protein [Microbacterium sp. KSW-48]